ncbi:hypothetical protein ABT56_12695 [Photobacterium aquae]|uniref:Uncharacterized protein n=1 Tax=Photobacterium aquae TaxID=1195763 RepID=A0A0J1JSJ0_9GAMM|nr:hypothetical protein [Photobacterium aquae]KLV05227.1 hypothetical protein ABT56_12695 [Photobacterium aquae]
MTQTKTLKKLFSRKACVDRVKRYQGKVRAAVIAGQFNEVEQLLCSLETAQKQLEAVYAHR